MKKTTTFLRFMLLLFIVNMAMSLPAMAAEVKLDEVNFPDAVFRTYISEQFDKDGNAELSEAEIAAVTLIDVSLSGGDNTSPKIKTLKGVEHFSNLLTLRFDWNAVTELDVSSLAKLQNLQLWGNSLEALNLSSNPALQILNCGRNKLATLDLSQNKALAVLLCSYNFLTELDLSQQASLQSLWCENNAIAAPKLNELAPLNTDVHVSPQALTVKVEEGGTVNLLALPNFVAANASNFSVGSYDNGILTVPENTPTVTYTYTSANRPCEVTLTLRWPEKVIAEINEINFPDAIFRTWISENCDPNHDGKLTNHEIENVTTIDFNFNSNTADEDKIADLTGIEFFTALTRLEANNCKLTELNVTTLTALTFLRCDNNDLTGLNVSMLTELDYLSCSNNDLTTLNVLENKKLNYLQCGNNKLTALDVSENHRLSNLQCNNNKIKTLNLENNSSLVTLNCRNNGLIALNLSNQPNLKDLRCEDNAIAALTLHANAPLDGSNVRLSPQRLTVNVTEAGTVNLTTLPNFVAANASNFSVGSYDNGILTVPENTPTVTYTYTSANRPCEVTLTLRWPEKVIAEINEINFPDAIFRTWISENCDPNHDGKLTNHEIAKVNGTIDFGFDRNTPEDARIADLTGIEYFTALTTLDASYCKLTELDVSALTNLTRLECSNNQLTALDVSENTALTNLRCNSNKITALDVSMLKNLTSLSCSNNQLTTLDLSQNTMLRSLTCGQNKYATVNLSANTNLTSLTFDSNSGTSSSKVKLQSLNIAHLTKLETLSCRYAAITSLDLSMMSELEQLRIDGSSILALKLHENVALNDKSNLTNLSASVDLRDVIGTAEYSLATIPGFDVTKMHNLVGAKLNESKTALLIEAGTEKVTYTYDCSAKYSINCTIKPIINVVELSEANFPDVDFRENIAGKFDTNKNNWLDSEELSKSKSLGNSYQFTSVKGIEYLHSMTKFSMYGGGFLTEADFSKNTALKELELANNALTTLDLSNQSKLAELDVSGNKLLCLTLNDAAPLTTCNVSGQRPGRIDLSTCTTDAIYPLSNIPGMDGTRITNLVGATLNAEKTALLITHDTPIISYTYDCGAGVSMACSASLLWPAKAIVAITPDYFPDANFRAYITTNCDTNGDGILDSNEITETTEINLSLNDSANDADRVKSLIGIHHFTALEKLLVEYNALTELDVTMLANLRELGCGHNAITGTLDLSHNSKLEQVGCQYNRISVLNFGDRAEKLFYLDCMNNRIKELDLTRLPAIKEVHCQNNQLNLLNPTQCPELTHLYCNSNKEISSLNLSQNPKLERLYVQNLSKLTDLDLSHNKSLREIHVEGTGLTTLDLTGFTQVGLVGINNTPMTSVKLDGTTNLGFFSAQNTKLHCISFPDSPLDAGITLLKNPLFAIHFSQKPQQKLYLDDTEETVDLTENNGIWTINLTQYGVDPARVTLADNTAQLDASGILTVPSGTHSVVYTYDCGCDITLRVTLKFNWNNMIADLFPDNAFRAHVAANYDRNGDGILQAAEAELVTEMTLLPSAGQIRDLRGIEQFPYLQSLTAVGHGLQSVDLRQNTALVSVDVSNNAIKVLDVSMLQNLESLNGNFNQISSLSLPQGETLTTLEINQNKLTSFNFSPYTGLTTLKCSYNLLSSIDLTQNPKLTDVECIGNPLYSCLTAKPFNLVSSHGANVVMVGNTINLGALEGVDPARIRAVSCDAGSACKCQYDPITGILTLEGKPQSLTYDYQQVSGLDTTIPIKLTVYAETELPKLANLDPVLADYVRYADLNGDGYLSEAECAQITVINLSNAPGIVTSLKGIEYFTELQYLNCSGHAIKVLDLSQNGRLYELRAENQHDPAMPQRKLLQTLILPNAAESLRVVYVGNNALTELDTRIYTNLESLHCQNNQLTSLLTHPNLYRLYCGNNRFTVLDLTQNTALAYLNLEESRYLTNLILPSSPALTMLNVNKCALSSLDLSRSTGLTLIYCNNTHLPYGLDLRAQTKLEHLNCLNSQLPSLLLPQSSVLTRIDCRNNALTSLDLSMLPGLQYLNCDYNNLLALNLSGNPALQELRCQYNRLTSLDFSHNLNLTRLFVQHNQISFFDTSMLDKLTTFQTTGNPVLANDDSPISTVTGGSGESTYVFRVGADNQINFKEIYGERLKNLQTIRVVHYNGATTIRVNQETGIVTLPPNTQIIELSYRHLGLDYSWSIRITCDILRTDELIPINETTFPDRIFRAWVETNVDINSDKQLSVPELEAWTSIELTKMGGKMTSLKGIEHFKALTSLNVYGNILTELDLSKNLNLESLICAGNALTKLDLTANEKLRFLDCSDNCLTSLILGPNTTLRKLECYYNYLTTLDISGCSALETLICYRNSLTSLKLGISHDLLREIDCSYNRLTTLNVSACTALTYLDCRNNNLNSLTLYQSEQTGCVLTDPINSGRTIDVRLFQARMMRSRAALQSVPLTNIPDFDITKLRLTEEQIAMGIVIDQMNQMLSFPATMESITCNYLISEHFATTVTFRMSTSAITLDASNFPDANLLAFAVTQDSQTDLALTDTECANILQINLPDSAPITNLSGIELFPNLISLDCTGGQLSDGTWGVTGLPNGTVSLTEGAVVTGNTLSVAPGVQEVSLIVDRPVMMTVDANSAAGSGVTLTIRFPHNTGYARGDANLDGIVDALDVNAVIAHIMNTTLLVGDAFNCADLDDNDIVNARDCNLLLGLLTSTIH